MSRKTLAWANKEVETFVCILGEEDVVYDVHVAAAVIDIRPTTKGYLAVAVGCRNCGLATRQRAGVRRRVRHAPPPLPHHCFIVSLASPTCCWALLVLPFSALQQLTDEWPLGPVFCNIYISLDIMLCTPPS
ncbi:unnamed protein product [Boreogadus saida]